MLTQMHATQDKAPLQVEAKKLVITGEGAHSFISVKIRQEGDSIVDGINILLHDSSALRVLVTDLDAACQAIEEEEDRERGLALKAAIHTALDRRVAERAETWRAPMRALLADAPPYTPVPASQADLEAAGLPMPARVDLATGGDGRCHSSGCERPATTTLDGLSCCAPCKADLENYYAAAKAEAR